MDSSGSVSTIFFLKLQNLKHFTKNWSRKEFGVVNREKKSLTKNIVALNILEETSAHQTAQ